jgi:hypothetical protein
VAFSGLCFDNCNLYGCQVWATFSLKYDWNHPYTRLGFLKRLLGVKKGTDTHCVLRETGQMPISFHLFKYFLEGVNWGNVQICATQKPANHSPFIRLEPF